MNRCYGTGRRVGVTCQLVRDRDVPMNCRKPLWRSGPITLARRGYGFLQKTGVIPPEHGVRCYWSGADNFGDALTPYIIRKLSRLEPFRVNKYCVSEYYALSGSIVQWLNRNAIVWGSGIVARDVAVVKPKKICAVRGPITRQRLREAGCVCPAIYGDPGLVLPRIYRPPRTKTFRLGIIPHYVDYDHLKAKSNDWDDTGVLIINICAPVEQVVREINQCERTVSSSLHGLIASHAYGVPSTRVVFSDDLGGDGTKFFDYFLSVGLPPSEGRDLKRREFSFETLMEISREGHGMDYPGRETIRRMQDDLMSTYPLRVKADLIDEEET